MSGYSYSTNIKKRFYHVFVYDENKFGSAWTSAGTPVPLDLSKINKKALEAMCDLLPIDTVSGVGTDTLDYEGRNKRLYISKSGTGAYTVMIRGGYSGGSYLSTSFEDLVDGDAMRLTFDLSGTSVAQRFNILDTPDTSSMIFQACASNADSPLDIIIAKNGSSADQPRDIRPFIFMRHIPDSPAISDYTGEVTKIGVCESGVSISGSQGESIQSSVGDNLTISEVIEVSGADLNMGESSLEYLRYIFGGHPIVDSNAVGYDSPMNIALVDPVVGEVIVARGMFTMEPSISGGIGRFTFSMKVDSGNIDNHFSIHSV